MVFGNIIDVYLIHILFKGVRFRMKKMIALIAVLAFVAVVSYGCAPSKKAENAAPETAITAEATVVTPEATTVVTKEAKPMHKTGWFHKHHKEAK